MARSLSRLRPDALLACLCACYILPGARGRGHRFLGSREGHNGLVHRHGPTDLLAELEQLEKMAVPSLKHATDVRAQRLETALAPLFRLAPHDAAGTVDGKAARYTLHRLFVERHGWHVSGIESHGAVRNSSNVHNALHSGERFTLKQLAHFAATLEALIHGENAERLQKAFDVYGFSQKRAKSSKDAKRAIEAYMVLFVMSHMNPASPPDYWESIAEVEAAYATWPETKAFAEEIRLSVFEGDESTTLWDACLRVVEEIGERYGKWQNRECKALKTTLMKMETKGTGRVPLSKFWEGLINDPEWLFTESAVYLDQLGALEGKAPHQNVLVANYMYSAANCIAGSKYYDVCCIDECESMLGELEAQVDAPAVEPQRLVALVSALHPAGSASREPRQIPASLVRRLDDIARMHGGVVPLHGRLFAQFMHHVFPSDCPYPHAHIVNSTAPVSHEDWIHMLDETAIVDQHMLEDYIKAAKLSSNAPETPASDLPWTDDEELFMRSVWLDGNGLGAGSQEASMRVPGAGVLLVLSFAVFFYRFKLLKLCGAGAGAMGSDKHLV